MNDNVFLPMPNIRISLDAILLATNRHPKCIGIAQSFLSRTFSFKPLQFPMHSSYATTTVCVFVCNDIFFGCIYGFVQWHICNSHCAKMPFIWRSKFANCCLHFLQSLCSLIVSVYCSCSIPYPHTLTLAHTHT